ncbi:MAG: hypothetical protein RMY28_023990 [Nostoc sp. ChiSLP01]
MTTDKGQMTNNKGQMTNNKGQMTNDKGQKYDTGRISTEHSTRKKETGNSGDRPHFSSTGVEVARLFHI